MLVGGLGRENRSANHNLLARQASTDLLLFPDADCAMGVQAVRELAAQAAEGTAVVKCQHTVWLTQTATERLLRSSPGQRLRVTQADIMHQNDYLPGLMYAMSRNVFGAIGGWDERFVGWGGEDRAVCCAASTLATLQWLPVTAYHLWHPPAPGGKLNKRDPGFLRNCRLRDRYRAAEGNVEAMLRLVRSR